MGVMDDSIQDRIGQGEILEAFMPSRNGRLAVNNVDLLRKRSSRMSRSWRAASAPTGSRSQSSTELGKSRLAIFAASLG